MTALDYRKLTEGDFAGVRRVALESWRKAYGGVYDEDYMRTQIDAAYSKEKLHPFVAKVQSDGAFFEVALRGTEVVGFAVVVLTPQGAEFTRLYVLPDFFGTRVGWTLFQHAELFIRARGYHRFYGLVQKDNERAQRFYLHANAKHVPELDTADEWYMEKILTPLGAAQSLLGRWRRALARAVERSRGAKL
jgi:ribosomal protein S18 acetylase RimI-like enzyme